MIQQDYGLTVTDTLIKKSVNATVYCPYDYPVEYLKSIVPKSVKVIQEKPTDEQLAEYDSIKKKLIKAQMLGLSIKPFGLAEKDNEISDTISMMNKDSFREQILHCIKTTATAKYYECVRNYLVGENSLYVNVAILTGNNEALEGVFEEIVTTENFAILINKECIKVLPISLNLIQDCINGIKCVPKLNDKPELGIPLYYKDVKSKDILYIHESNQELLVKTKKEQLRINLNDLKLV